MWGRYRNVLLLFVVFLVLTSYYNFFLADKPVATNAEPSASPLPQLMRFTSDKVRRIEAQNASGSMIFVKEGDVWKVSNNPTLQIDNSKVDMLLQGFSMLDASGEDSDNKLKEADVGLVNTQRKVLFELADGTKYELAFGKKTFDGSSYYAKKPNNARIYWVPAYTVDDLDNPATYYAPNPSPAFSP